LNTFPELGSSDRPGRGTPVAELTVNVTSVVRSSSSARGFSLMEMVVVCGIMAAIAAIAVPQFGNALAYLRLSGDARSVSNALALTKLDAAAQFTRSRLYVDIPGRNFYVQRLVGTHWQAAGPVTYLSPGVTFGHGSVGSAPAYTQATISDTANPCKDDAGTVNASSECVIFNSRGTPVDSTGSPPANMDAVYVTDSTRVYGMTVSKTGVIRNWQTPLNVTPTWTAQ
jgi:prepilin-type N-terminal cleavage/methylation domain-containing protein